MKILFAPSDNNLTSGAFRSMSVLNRILNQKYNIETLVVLPNDGDGQQLLDELGVKHVQINSYGWIVKSDRELSIEDNNRIQNEAKNNLNAVQEFIKLIKKEKIDIVHVNTSYNYVAAMAAHICNKPVIWHLREFLEEDQRRRFYNKDFALPLINKSERIVCISKALKEKYRGVFNEDKLKVIYNGIDTETFYKPKKKIFTNKKKIFFCAGAVNYSKGQDCLVKACGKLFEKGYKDFELWLSGTIDERYTKIINDLAAKYGIQDKVKILGRRSDVDKLLEEVDISFMCSRFEAFGRVTVEAMLSGALLIGANSGGTLEIVKDKENGYLFEQGNPDDLCDKIIYALEHKDEATKLAKNGRKEMKETMSADRNAKEIAELYNEVLATFNYKRDPVYAVVVTYNRVELLKKCIDALLSQTYKDLKLLIVDNASTDNTREYVESIKDNRILYCNTMKNIGGAGGFNYGMKIAYFLGARWVWIMDDDVIPEKTALSELVTATKSLKKKDNAYFASCVYGLDGKAMNTPGVDPKAPNGYPFWFEHLDKGMVRLNSATFVSLLINSHAIEKCGLPYKDFFIWGDDTEYTKRLYRNFGDAYLVGKSKVVHARKEQSNLSILTEPNENRVKMYFYFIRNTLVYTREYGGEEAFKNKLNLFNSYCKQLASSKDPLKDLKIQVIKNGIDAYYVFNFNKFNNRFDVLVDEHFIEQTTTSEPKLTRKAFYKQYRKQYGLKETIKRLLYGPIEKSCRWYFFKIITFVPRAIFHLFKKILKR